ncbi:MAG: cytochrome c [Azospirillaceae bacterium]|nr:cytochrome c [Azospirillaceae bacterium]
MRCLLPRALALGLSLCVPVVATVLVAAPSAGRAADADSIARGKYLFDAADCAGCHGGDRAGTAPSGGLGLDTPFGVFHVPNITPDRQYGIGAWSVADFQAALRTGIGHKGEYLFPVFPYTAFTHMTDGDSADLYAYLMSLPPVAQPNKPHQVNTPFGWRALLFFWRILFFSEGALAVDPARGDDWNRGNYLVHAVAHCEECHTPRNVLGALKPSMAFSGNVGGPDGQNAPNITSDVATGIGDWSVEDIQRLLKSGLTPQSDQVGSGMKAVVRGTSKLTDADRHAIAVYLKSVPPIHVDLPPPKPPA